MSTPPDPTAQPQGDPQGSPAPTGLPPEPPETGEPEKDWKAEAEKWKRLSRENETRAKANADAAAKLAAIEDKDKTEAERLADQLKAAQEHAAGATRLAVAAKVEALASGRFADPQDAVDALAGGEFVTPEGQINADAITEALDGLLQRKPHWARTESGPRIPAPDPSQGARPGGPALSLDQRIAEAEKSGDVRTALALKTQKLREQQKTNTPR